MVFLTVTAVILLLILCILFLPFAVFLEFRGKLKVKLKFAGIKIFETKDKPKKQKPKKEKKEPKEDKSSEKKESSLSPKAAFKRLKEEKGFTGAVKETASFLFKVISKIKKLLKHIKLKKVYCIITVATDDAATTAIHYGTVCGAVYPLTAAVESYTKIGVKEIDVKTDFNDVKSNFDISAEISSRIFYFILTAIKIFKEYKKFITETNENERK